MTWREKTIIRILLLIAHMFAKDASLAGELTSLASHISVWTPEVK